MAIGGPDLRSGPRALEGSRPNLLPHAAAALLAALSAEPLVRHLGLAGAAWGMVAQQLLLALLLTAASHAGRPRDPARNPRPGHPHSS